MAAESPKTDKTTGWVLAGVVFAHLLMLRSPVAIVLAVFVLLLLGAILRAAEVYMPRWVVRILLVIGLLGVAFAERSFSYVSVPAEMAALTACTLLLRPLTPTRGLWVIFCLLVMLLGIILLPIATVGGIFIVVDVVVFMLLAEQAHRPPEVQVNFWVSIMRSLRVVVPVAIVVTLIFSFFPDFSQQTRQVFNNFGTAGFDGAGMLDPSNIASVAQSQRVALVARFPKDRPLPLARDLYWRGQVLEKNEGLRWTLEKARTEAPRGLEQPSLEEGRKVWFYAQQTRENKEGILPVLDRTLYVDARREGLEVAVLNQGASVMSVVGEGDVNLVVTAVDERAADAPEPGIANGGTAVLPSVSGNEALKRIVDRVFSGAKSTPAKLEAIGRYLRDTGFSYTTRPGQIRSDDVSGFLITRQRGFCSHYAAAVANLLRMGGVPARVVTGFRGGDWNPWVRTITVRDAQAHAWVEAWDEPTKQWLRFDPTTYVKPEFTTDIQRNMNSEEWPWYRMVGSLGGAAVYTANTGLSEAFTWVMSLTIWEYLQPVAMVSLLIFGSIWLYREYRKRQARTVADLAAAQLEELERRAVRAGCARQTGETPLAWLRRLEKEAGEANEAESLRQFARLYEGSVYSAKTDATTFLSDLAAAGKSLRQIWKNRGHAKLAVP